MYILGINGSPNRVYDNQFDIGEGNYHDSGAAILHDGHIVTAIEEERLNRIKHTNKWPVQAVKACLSSCNLSIDEVDCIAFSISKQKLEHILFHFYNNQDDPGPVPDAYSFLQHLLEEYFEAAVPREKIEMFEHHYAHAVTAFYPSSFKEALVLSIDGYGGEYSGSVYAGRNNELTLLKTFSLEQSLGHFYHHITSLLGFGPFDEYKVMGLAPYGNPKTYRNYFKNYYSLLKNGNYNLYNHRAEELSDIIPPKKKGFTQVHMDIAAGLQETLERIVLHIVKHHQKETGLKQLCLAGGVALNCTLNGKLINSGMFRDVFVFPAANDSGLPIGSALAAYFKRSKDPQRSVLKTMYLGSGIGSTSTIKETLDAWKLFVQYEQVENVSEKAASLLAAGKVMGWVQGRSEFAPRALGNRSILADARPAHNKERINSIVKKREGFRPFAPSVLEEYAHEYFVLPEGRSEFAYMIFVMKVQEKYKELLGAITHVDASARVHTVSKTDNLRYWKLIDQFRQITGTPVLLNTSFNNNAEPIVDSVHDAIVCFLTTELDYLVVDDLLVSKKSFSRDCFARLKVSIPPYSKLKKHETHSWAPNPGIRYKFEIANTFNDRGPTVNAPVFEVLLKANGNKTIEELLDENGIDDATEKQQVLDKLLQLWDARVIALSPSTHEEYAAE